MTDAIEPLVYNAWYVAAWSHEVGTEPLARRIMDRDVVLFRDASGQVGALEDRCCHRGAPLRLGSVVETRANPRTGCLRAAAVEGDGVRCQSLPARRRRCGRRRSLPSAAREATAGRRAKLPVGRQKTSVVSSRTARREV